MSKRESNTESTAAEQPARESRPRQALPSPGALIAQGARVLPRYKGLFISLYLVQLVIAGMVTWTVSTMLATAFAERPLFDEAVEGDVAALVFIVTDQQYLFASILWLALGTVLGYAILSWYLIGGLNAVLVEAPDTRGEVVKRFGMGGARTFYGYARLFLLSLIPYAVISGLFLFGLSGAADELAYSLTLGDVAAAVLPRLGPALLLLLIHLCALDYARIELARTIGLASRHALWRGYKMVLTDWRPLAHVLAYVAFFVLVSAVYVYALHGSAMAGAFGAVALFALRQLFSMIRYAGKITCAAGQVAYARANARDEKPRQRLPVLG